MSVPPLNQLQAFMADGNSQTEPVVMEDVKIGGEVVKGTFGDAVMMPVMTQEGYQDQLVTPVKIAVALLHVAPKAKQSLTRISVNRDMFIQIVDISNPIVWTLLVTDRVL